MICQTWSILLREEICLNVFERWLLRTVLGLKKKKLQEAGNSWIVSAFMIFTSHQTLLERWNLGRLDGRGIWHARKKNRNAYIFGGVD
jgi:hypothetical protein